MNENIVTILFMHFIFSLIYSWCDAFDAMMHTKQPPDQLELYINDEHKSYYYYYNAIWLLRWCCCAVLFFSHDWCSRFHASFVTNVWVFVSPSSCFLPDRQNENIFFLKKMFIKYMTLQNIYVHQIFFLLFLKYNINLIIFTLVLQRKKRMITKIISIGNETWKMDQISINIKIHKLRK